MCDRAGTNSPPSRSPFGIGRVEPLTLSIAAKLGFSISKNFSTSGLCTGTGPSLERMGPPGKGKGIHSPRKRTHLRERKSHTDEPACVQWLHSRTREGAITDVNP